MVRDIIIKDRSPKVKKVTRRKSPSTKKELVTCANCRGNGRIQDPNSIFREITCPTCKGVGKVRI